MQVFKALHVKNGRRLSVEVVSSIVDQVQIWCGDNEVG
jgi:hypothetical protein